MKPLQEWKERIEGFEHLVRAEEFCWCNPELVPFGQAECGLQLTMEDILDACRRLERFAPFFQRRFPQTVPSNGLIESPLKEAANLKARLGEKYETGLTGRLYLKLDSELPIAGSIKARGGIYEVLKHTEELALAQGLIHKGESYAALAKPKAREMLSHYTIQVGSTGNLGLSIGIMSAALGYRAVVHMSEDAKQWKKDLLRSHGVTVVEYASDYSEAVKEGRRQSDCDPNSYFVDDENSKILFLGYAVAALRLRQQLEQADIPVDGDHPLFVYLPCGVGGAPGGITFGLKQVFGDAVHCFFVEPVNAPCMLLGMASGKNNGICVQDIGLTGVTHADGLAVTRPSSFVGGMMRTLLSGIFTVSDAHLYDYLRDVWESETIFLEPSACAALAGPVSLLKDRQSARYLQEHGLIGRLEQANHILWATGGRLVPETIRESYRRTYLK